MRATIIDLDYGRGLYAFERSDGEYGYFELLDGLDLELDDELVGDFSGLGGVTVRHQETNESVDICIEDFCSLAVVKQIIH